MTSNEFAIKYDTKELRELADEVTRVVVIRSYKNGNSSDDKRAATQLEREILSKVLYAALIAYAYRTEENNGSADAICDTMEFTCHQFFPEINAYDTLYSPFRAITETW